MNRGQGLRISEDNIGYFYGVACDLGIECTVYNFEKEYLVEPESEAEKVIAEMKYLGVWTAQ